jgi:hypothetical protein
MATWRPTARQAFNQGVTATHLARATAKQLENDIDFWAGTIGAQNRRTFYPQGSQATFEVWAERHEVTDVQYSY